MIMGTDKHQITCTEREWSAVQERAKIEGVNAGRLLMRAFETYQRSTTATPLLVRANLSPQATGDSMLGHLLHEGSIIGACVKLGATRQDWDSAVCMIPGLKEKIDICGRRP